MSSMKDLLGDAPYADAYPLVPGYKATGTSQESAARIAPKVSGIRAKVLASLRDEGPATPDEVAERLNISLLSIRPRFSELSTMSLIVPTGERRRNYSGHSADVYKITEAGAKA